MERFVGVLRLDASVFAEVEDDPTAMRQAIGVVVLVAVAEGLTALQPSSIPELLGGLVRLSALAPGLWAVSTALTWLVGVKLLHGTGEYYALLRVLAFAAAPKILLMFAVIPLGLAVWPLLFIVLGLTIWTTVLALRQALQIPVGKAMALCLVKLAFAAAMSAMPHGWLGLGTSLRGLPDPRFRAPSHHRPGIATMAPAPAIPRLPVGR